MHNIHFTSAIVVRLYSSQLHIRYTLHTNTMSYVNPASSTISILDHAVLSQYDVTDATKYKPSCFLSHLSDTA